MAPPSVGPSAPELVAGRFQVSRLLGRGGMGVVYEAIDRMSGVRVALKTLGAVGVSAGQGLYHLKNEYRALQDLSHPNLVSLGDMVEHDGQWFITMELLDGVDFLTYVRGQAACATLPSADLGTGEQVSGDFDEERLREALKQVLCGLRALHAAGKVHRDVKPTNILVSPEGRVVLVDFGLTTDARTARQSVGDAVGTVLYMAPEQAASKAVGPPADIYAVGTIMFEALTGFPPFGGEPLHVMLRKQTENAPPPRSLNNKVPRDLDSLCARMLQVSPSDRPTALQILRELDPNFDESQATSAGSRVSASDVFLGREAEWQLLEEMLASLSSGGRPRMLLHGESGVGKTTLLTQFCEHATRMQEGLFVLTGRCYEREAVPYKGFDGVIDELVRRLRKLSARDVAALMQEEGPLLARIFPVLGRVVPGGASGERVIRDQQELRARAFAALARVFRALTRDHPLILVIDDVQWADADTVELLVDLLKGDDPPWLMLLLCARSDVAAGFDALARLRTALGSQLHEMQITALDAGAAEHLARALLMKLAPNLVGSAKAIARESSGHPLYIAELVQHAAMTASSVSAPPRLEDAIWERTRQLRGSSQLLLSVLALAAGPLPLEVLARAAEIPIEQCSREASVLRVARLSRWTPGGLVEPYHDRIRDAVRMRLREEEAIELHRRLAAALETEEGRLDLVVHHLVASGQGKRAALMAREAGERAERALAFDRAAGLYALVLELKEFTAEDERNLRIARARALAKVGRCWEAAAAYREASVDADPETHLDCQQGAAQQLLISGHIEEGLGVIQTLLAAIGERLPATPRRALFALIWHRIRLKLRGFKWVERRLNQITREQLVRVDAFKVVSAGLAMVDTIRGADFSARCLRAALDVGEVTRVALALGMEATFLGSQGGSGLEKGMVLAQTVSGLASQNNDPYFSAWAKTSMGMALYFHGRFAESVKVLEAAVDIYRTETYDSTWECNNSKMFRVFAMRHLGNLRRIREVFRQDLLDAQRRGDRYMDTSLRRYCSFLFLADDDLEGGRQNLDAARWAPPEGNFHVQHWYELEARAEWMLYSNRYDDGELDVRFAQFESSMLVRVQIVRALARFLRGRHLVTRFLRDGDRAHLRKATRMFKLLKGEKTRHSEVWAKLLKGTILAASGERENAARLFAETALLAQEREMQLMRAVAIRRRGELMPGDEGRVLVREADVWLLDQGVRNPERFVAVYAPG